MCGGMVGWVGGRVPMTLGRHMGDGSKRQQKDPGWWGGGGCTSLSGCGGSSATLSSCGGAPLTCKHHRNLARHCRRVYVLQDPALSFLESMAARYGIKPEARHVTYVVSGLAKATNFDDASSLIDAAGNRGWGRNAGEPGQHGCSGCHGSEQRLAGTLDVGAP